MGSGAVGLNPVVGSVRGAVDRHDHAALGKTTLVLIFVFWLDFSVVAMLVTLKRFGKERGSQEGFRVRGDPDFSQSEKRCFFHGIGRGSIVGRQEHRCDGSVMLGDDIELRAVGPMIDGEQAEALLER